MPGLGKPMEDDDVDLWASISKQVNEEQDDLEKQPEGENDEEQQDVREPCSITLSVGNDYLVLAKLAKRQSMKIKNVPGDGNCFFQAVSVLYLQCRLSEQQK